MPKLCSIRLVLVVAILCVSSIEIAFGQADKSNEVFFESRIRPALVKHCLECHAAETEINGGLSLDSAAGWQRGGDTGVAIVKGKPDESLLVKAIEYHDPQLQMPPDGKLPEKVLDDFREWIRRGAIDPRPEVQPPKPSTALPLERANEHWAYRPIVQASIPQNDAASPIDAFIVEKLAQSNVEPTSSVSKAVLIRRLMFDLHGLPPTPEEIERFESDVSLDAYERLVDSLLSSPRFGERMARRWLDVSRYAESLTLRGFVMGNAWRYRDYIIQSFAEDRPFDEMLREQIAGDLMSSSDLQIRQRQIVATTFLLLGNSNLEEQDKQQLEMDVIDEQLDLIGRAILGQTIACARCHDHKFDPIPTHDYYALAGVLKTHQVLDHENVSKWIEGPLPAVKDEEDEFAEIASHVSELTMEIDKHRKLLTANTKRTTPVVAVKDLLGIVIDDVQAEKIGTWQPSSHTSVYVGEGYIHDQNQEQGNKTVSFEPQRLTPGSYELRLAYAPSDNRATNTRVSVFSADGEANLTINQQTTPPIDGLWISLGRYRFEKDGQAFVIVSNEGANGHVIADAIQFLPETTTAATTATEKLVGKAYKRASKSTTKDSESGSTTSIASELKIMEATKKKQEALLQKRPMAMTMRLRKDASDLAIHIRGDVHNLGKVVPRGTLQLVNVPRPAESDDKPFDRLALAQWMTADEQPLVARVFANRVWGWMMGEGIVQTVDNLGTTGEAPSHPELLDYLAKQLLSNHWSTRRLVKEIVLSETYQRSSATIATSELADPDNRLLWRSHRRRLDAESIRDAMLCISGQLNLSMYGRRMPDSLKSDYGYVHNDVCRSIYVPVLRNAVSDAFEAFDVADPSTVVGKRNRSTIASQALWMMNHPWVREQATKTAELLLEESMNDFDQALEHASMRILGRKLTTVELSAIAGYVATDDSKSRLDADKPSIDAERLEQLTMIVQSLFQSLDFRFPE
ncbi:MAG: DUF1553 domain-containing protein [Pirellulaceae bacterium]|nr:DUF1553 domain-containing protein [Pirellulaceae bacterium]